MTLAETKGFIGERFDDGAGLQYLNARYYDPRLAMFLQPDWWEVTSPGVGTNRYSYAEGDPVNRLDPNGNGWLKDAWNDLKKSVSDSFGALGDALSGKATHIDNGGQFSNGDYGIARGLDGNTYGCFGCSGSGEAAQTAIDEAGKFADVLDALQYPEVSQNLIEDAWNCPSPCIGRELQSLYGQISPKPRWDGLVKYRGIGN